jgi:hypothetical protein
MGASKVVELARGGYRIHRETGGSCEVCVRIQEFPEPLRGVPQWLAEVRPARRLPCLGTKRLHMAKLPVLTTCALFQRRRRRRGSSRNPVARFRGIAVHGRDVATILTHRLHCRDLQGFVLVPIRTPHCESDPDTCTEGAEVSS